MQDQKMQEHDCFVQNVVCVAENTTQKSKNNFKMSERAACE